MICLTCDIHDMTLNTGNQQHSDKSESSIAVTFAEILKYRNLKTTYFLTGRCVDEECHILKPLFDNESIEFAGHTYFCFTPALWHRGWNVMTHNYNGPQWYQNRDIVKTKESIRSKTGRSITSWRNHMYMHGPHTESLLIRNGIPICCDGVRRTGALFERHPSGILNFPINIIPDHEHLYHAERTPRWVEKWVNRYGWSDDYGSSSYYFDEWFEILKREVIDRERIGRVSHLIIHPITLYLCDGYRALERVANFLADFESKQVSELLLNLN